MRQTSSAASPGPCFGAETGENLFRTIRARRKAGQGAIDMKARRSGRGRPVKYPVATVIPYGPDDKTVTKLVVGILPTEQAETAAPVQRWVATDVADSEDVARQMYAFMKAHRVKTVVTSTVVMGCPHEEGKDFPDGGHCPFCPFWRGKQGSATDDERWDRLETVRVERLGFHYRFWLPRISGT